MNPNLLETEWEGIIGEPKDLEYKPTREEIMVDLAAALKFESDEDYEVNSSFSTRCKGCHHRNL